MKNLQAVGLAAPLRHALQALAFIVAHPQARRDTPAVARLCGVPAAALSKSFQLLARRGLLESRKGPGGGYLLARPASRITLAEVAASLGANERRHGCCVLRKRACRRDGSCLLHAAAMEADARVAAALRGLTLADLAAETLKAEAA